MSCQEGRCGRAAASLQRRAGRRLIDPKRQAAPDRRGAGFQGLPTPDAAGRIISPWGEIAVSQTRLWTVLGAAIVAAAAAASLYAQQGNQPGGNRGGRDRDRGREEAAAADEGYKLPSDPKLLQLHKEFVQKAEKLAKDYENANQTDKARVVYEEILKLVPKYPAAVEALARIGEQEITAEKKSLDIFANKGLTDTGVIVQAGKPIRIVVTGTWTLNLSHELGPDGMEIPEELRDFDLGALVGGVDTGNPDDWDPFAVGKELTFTADQTGRLMLGMWDSEHDDNQGKLHVTIEGTFKKN
jgi:hypothetical protein